MNVFFIMNIYFLSHTNFKSLEQTPVYFSVNENG